MNLPIRLGYLFLLLSSTVAAYAQSGAQITLSQGNVTAGDSFNLKLTLETPTPCKSNIVITFASQGTPESDFSAVANVEANATSASFTVVLARDLAGGEYRPARAQLYPCPGFQNPKEITVPPVVVSVRALPDATKYPTRADLTLSVTQKQFFDTKIAQLDELDRQLTTKIEGRAADTQDLREILISTVNSAERALAVTENQYREQIMGGKGAPPAFFADFHAQYHALLVEFRAPIPGTAQSEARRGLALIQVAQLKTRPNQSTKPEDLSGTYPPDVIATRQAMADNKSAYNYIVSSGRVTFDAQFYSIPKGAQISYKKLIDTDFKDYSELTDVPHATFELATWRFKFHKNECSDDQVRTIDPYQDTDPVVRVEFSHCRGK